jgi:methylenetetrahydrofolate dehydrogenase (NADP+) / methenyltetrahydrofolate cyclohydrolase
VWTPFTSYIMEVLKLAVILDGKKIAAGIQEELKSEIKDLLLQGISPQLSVVLVGDDPASQSYVRGKHRTAEKLGITSEVITLPDTVTSEELFAVIDRLNTSANVDGILVQLPLPKHIDEHEVLIRVSPEKDVDGFHPLNAGLRFVGIPGVTPCTPAGIMEILKREKIPVAGKHAVVIGRSNIVGKPLAMLLLAANATVTICHSKTRNLSVLTRQADILVSAVGQAGLIGQEDVKPGAVVIDVGVNRVNGKLVGDVDFLHVKEVASAITPVPGGVGPLTITMLMKNTVELGKRRRGI